MEKNSFSARLTEFLLIQLGLLLMSVGVYFFKIPNGFSTGGVSGIATLLGGLIPAVTPGMLILIINVLLLVLGFIFLGRQFGVRTVWCSLVFSLETRLFEILLPLEQPLTDQPLLELIYAMLLTAIGSAILFSRSASSGGTDIVAMILKKYTSLDTGRALLVSDFVIAASAFFVFGVRTGLFSLLGLFSKAFLVDSVIESMNQCKYFTIVTDKPEPICRYIIDTMGHTVTSLDAEGAYSHQKKKVLLVVCRRLEGVKLRRVVRELDPASFCMVTNTSEIIGRGFRAV